MATEFRDAPLYDFIIHKMAEDEAGEESGETYNYYLYIHPAGIAIIMREKSDYTEYKYAKAGIGETQWSNRTNLQYVNYDQLSEKEN